MFSDLICEGNKGYGHIVPFIFHYSSNVSTWLIQLTWMELVRKLSSLLNDQNSALLSILFSGVYYMVIKGGISVSLYHQKGKG